MVCSGTDINVPPPTTDDQNYAAIRPLGPGEEDDGQYREDPSIYWKDERYNRPAAKQAAAPRPSQYYSQPQQPAQYEEEEPQYQQAQYQQPQQQHRFQYQQPEQPKAYYQTQAYHQQPAQRQQPRYQAQQPQPGYDINTGSYTVSFTG